MTPALSRCGRIPASEKCPICGHRGGWCLLSPDRSIAICPRVESPRRIGEAGWLHRLDDAATGRRSLPEPRPAAPSAAVPCAADANLDRVYRAVLNRLSLATAHRDHLRSRGLADDDLARAGYRSLPAGCRADILRQLRERWGDAVLLSVPGIIVRDGTHGRYLTLAGRPGILVPIRSVVGHVVGLVVRPDDPGDGGKYRWLSSVPTGPSPGWRVHVPAGTKPRARVVIVEGSLKADVASALAPGRSIIGLPGCVVTAGAIEVLHQLSAEEALLALDADATDNVHVARAQVEGLQRLHAAGFQEGAIRWDRSMGKGLDDMLLTLRGAAR